VLTPVLLDIPNGEVTEELQQAQDGSDGGLVPHAALAMDDDRTAEPAASLRGRTGRSRSACQLALVRRVLVDPELTQGTGHGQVPLTVGTSARPMLAAVPLVTWPLR
jgi:hypothetical protein